MLTPVLTDVERVARDDRPAAEVIASVLPEHHGAPWRHPDSESRLQHVLDNERLTARRLVGPDGYLDLSLVFPPEDSDMATRIKRAVSSDHGLVIVAGPTHSGKAVTLAAIARHLVSTSRRVGRLEDTYEVTAMRNPGFIASDPDPDELFPSSSRDVIVAAEIRTDQDAIDALRASRANAVLAAMHGPSAAVILGRLAEHGLRIIASTEHLDNLLDPWRLTPFNTLAYRWPHKPEATPPMRLTVVCQRLVKRLCESCSSDGEPRGCEQCRQGYRGNAALAGTLEIEAQSIADLSTLDVSAHETLRPFNEHAAALVANKVTTQDEIRRVLGHEVDPGLVARGAAVAGGLGNS